MDMLITVPECSTCGEQHVNMPVYRLAEPKVLGGVAYTHLTICPVTCVELFVIDIV